MPALTIALDVRVKPLPTRVMPAASLTADPDTATRLRTARRSRGLSQATAARLIGVSLTTLKYFERGVQEPRVSQLKTLCLAYLVTADDILGLA